MQLKAGVRAYIRNVVPDELQRYSSVSALLEL